MDAVKVRVSAGVIIAGLLSGLYRVRAALHEAQAFARGVGRKRWRPIFGTGIFGIVRPSIVGSPERGRAIAPAPA